LAAGARRCAPSQSYTAYLVSYSPDGSCSDDLAVWPVQVLPSVLPG